MTKILLSKAEISEALSLSPDVARATLAARGVLPIDMGLGRGRGLRWYAVAVQQAAEQMHAEAQARTQKKTHSKPKKLTTPPISLASMTTAEIFDLTAPHAVQ